MSLSSNTLHRNSHNESEDRHVKAIAYIAKSATPREIAAIIDEDVLATLAWDGVTVEDLQALLRGQAVHQVLDQFRWTGQWTDTAPRLFIVADSEERGLALIEWEGLDPYRVFTYVDAAEVRRDVAINDAAGVPTEVIIVGGAR